METENAEELVLRILNRLGATSFLELSGLVRLHSSSIADEELKKAVEALIEKKKVQVRKELITKA